MDLLHLYRGDCAAIDEFKFSKTNKYGLLGQGIYLTSSLSLAKTYRSKGSTVDSEHMLFTGPAANRLEAHAKAELTYAEIVHRRRAGYHSNMNATPAFKKALPRYREEFQELLSKGTIKSVYLDSTRSLVDGKARIRVTWYEHDDFGAIAQFAFPRKLFDKNVINVDAAVNDPFFWELVYKLDLSLYRTESYSLDRRPKLGASAQSVSLEAFIAQNRGLSFLPRLSSDRYTTWPKLRRTLEPYGIIGFEYAGGIRLGGGHHHRAFCIWDEEFINKHRVA